MGPKDEPTSGANKNQNKIFHPSPQISYDL